VLHHVSLEVLSEQVEPSVKFWGLLGFDRVSAPEPIAPFVAWFEASPTPHAAFAAKAAHTNIRTQIHLIEVPEPTVPKAGHAAVVTDDFQGAFDRLVAAGFEVEESRELWGERRAFATAPGGHMVEIMAAPPPPVSG
jgi:catechol 2,3-dioxygenase-like lactoylglutathione lyase family enzyme